MYDLTITTSASLLWPKCSNQQLDIFCDLDLGKEKMVFVVMYY